MLDQSLKSQTIEFLNLLEGNICFTLSLDNSENSQKLENFIQEICDLDPKHLSYTYGKLDFVPAFSIDKVGQEKSGIIFAGIPLGHEYNSFILALLQVSGRSPKIDEATANTIRSIKEPLHFVTYASLTCHNCPDVVQALNIFSVLNPNITHTMVDGAWFESQVEELGIMSVPAVYKNGESFFNGKASIDSILETLSINNDGAYQTFSEKLYDVTVIGAGPAGVTSAIYAARKGLKTAIIFETMGGQVNDTVGIENIIGTPYIEGSDFSKNLEKHLRSYDVDLIAGTKVQSVSSATPFNITLKNQVVIQSKTVIIATGARWRDLNIPGETEFKTKGVVYCPHCDAPLFKGKRVAVIGGGNSGVEAAIDLANIVNHVDVLEFSPEFKADNVLLDRAKAQKNITMISNAQTLDIFGNSHVEGLHYLDRTSNHKHALEVEGIFVQIGLMPNTDFITDIVQCNERGEIIVNENGETNIPGLFAAGDCTDSTYKQIIISMGSGAKASLSAFDYLIRHQA